MDIDEHFAYISQSNPDYDVTGEDAPQSPQLWEPEHGAALRTTRRMPVQEQE